MKNADEAIEKVLAGLRETEAAPGIERRALDGARSRQAARPRRTQLPVLCSVAFAAMMAAALTLWMNRRSTTPRAPLLANRAPLNAVPPAAPPANTARVSARQVVTVGSASRPAVRVTAVESSDDALALREMRAPSRPAPPMPLTQQEKVLREIARAPDPQQLAMLDPVLREKQETEANAEFQRFLNSQQKGEVTNEMESQ